MKKNRARHNAGIDAIIKHGRKLFRIKENLDFYSPEDYKKAETTFVKTCILHGKCRL